MLMTLSAYWGKQSKQCEGVLWLEFVAVVPDEQAVVAPVVVLSVAGDVCGHVVARVLASASWTLYIAHRRFFGVQTYNLVGAMPR